MKTLLWTVGCALLVMLGSQPEQQATTTPPRVGQPAAAVSKGAAAWTERLEKLHPSRPVEYFLLGEEVAEGAADPELRKLAAQLFVLAYELDARANGAAATPSMGASACLALASIASRDDERRWLRALAETFTSRAGVQGGRTADDRSMFSLQAGFELATAIGLARSGEGRRAEQLLDKPGVSELLDQYDLLPTPDGTPGSLKNFLKRAIRDWPVCPQCRNRRAVPAGANRSGEMVRCDTCRGNPGPVLTERELSNQLRMESTLLQGSQRSWAAQVLSDGGAPLRDLDPSELAGTYQADAGKPVWRGGQWSAAEAAVAAPPVDANPSNTSTTKPAAEGEPAETAPDR